MPDDPKPRCRWQWKVSGDWRNHLRCELDEGHDGLHRYDRLGWPSTHTNAVPPGEEK